MDTTKQIKDLQDQITKLTSQVNDLSSQVYKNNFSNTQVFNKAAEFGYRLKPPVYSAVPSTGDIGDVFSISGTLYIVTSTNPIVATVVGTQS